MKTVLITGASGGIGSAIAKKFAYLGYATLLVYNKDKKSIDILDKELKSYPHSIYKCDLIVDSEVRKMIDDIIEKYGHIDCLVNCAGVSRSSLIQDCTDEDYSFIFDSNVRTCVQTTKYVSKHMIRAKYGKIVNVSSMWGKVGSSMESLYSASKGALDSLTLSLAKELGPSGINVNAVLPGLIDTKMNSGYSHDEIASIVSDTPLNRIGEPMDVANLVAFLCSDEASFITGQLITIDGGLTL